MPSKLETVTAYLALFVPATRAERFANAAASGATAIIIDLEDGVAIHAKETARDLLRTHVTDDLVAKVDVFVRVNAVGTEWFDGDVRVVADLPVDGVMLSKCESPDQVKALKRQLADSSQVIALIESPQGMLHARSVAAVAERLAFGSVDYSLLINAAHNHRALAHARSELVLAAALAGRMSPIDGVTTNFFDPRQVLIDARHGAMMGMGGKLLIHPMQIAPARQAYCPSAVDLKRAREVLKVEDAGAVALDGMMVDAPVIAWARRIVASAAALGIEH
jgi:citrate lyase subunit beta / citryl-CoA lyase